MSAEPPSEDTLDRIEAKFDGGLFAPSCQAPFHVKDPADPRQVACVEIERSGALDGDLIFFAADTAAVANACLGGLRQSIGHARGLAEPGWRQAWLRYVALEKNWMDLRTGQRST